MFEATFSNPFTDRIGSCPVNDTKYQHERRRRRRAYLRYAHDESSKCNPTKMSHCTSPGL